MKTYKEIERILHSYRAIQAEVKNLKLEIEEIKDDVSISGTNFDAVDSGRCDSKGNTSKVEQEVFNREKKIERIEREIRSKERLIQKVDNALETLKDEQRRFVVDRYFNKVPVANIAEKIGIETITGYKRKDVIINKLREII